MTLRIYSDQKGLPAARIRTCVGYTRDPQAALPDIFVRRISVDGALDDGDRQRLLEIAGRCPIHRTLERGARIETQLGEPPAEAGPVDTHARLMEAAITSGSA
jgi:putative redox protein